MLAGHWAVNNVGHCHPKVVRAIQDQRRELMQHFQFFRKPSTGGAQQAIGGPEGKLSHVFLTNSGAESVEGAIKIARKYASKKKKGGENFNLHENFFPRPNPGDHRYRGRAKYQKVLHPFLPFVQVDFNDIHALENAIQSGYGSCHPEPVQGEEESYRQKKLISRK